MEQYVTKILGMAQEVKDAGYKLEDTLIAMLLLRWLTLEFQPLRITLQTSSVQLTTDYAKGQLLQQEYTPRGREGNTSDRAFFIQNRGRHNQDVTQKKKKKTETAASFVGGLGIVLLTATRIPQERPWKATPKNQNFTLFAAVTANVQVEDWYLDSGATEHMTNNKDILKDLCEVNATTVTSDNNEKLRAEGLGRAEVYIKDTPGYITIKDIMFVPNTTVTLLSVSKLEEDLNINGKIIASASEEQGMYKLCL
ncbi:hypothetical protein PR048_000890 [Dryococelus australis]|uniref:Retrovirus-related Pol polyprotein from transposon TNT 1-94-like beta-barrel domain-containing protein n=1 Tax=Dryococelus australis TaxID=614101 RepID=A0ABQ9IH45_9NEOP|nr:hypothetical protein PR048_000890 [Dryococelus australis]